MLGALIGAIRLLKMSLIKIGKLGKQGTIRKKHAVLLNLGMVILISLSINFWIRKAKNTLDRTQSSQNRVTDINHRLKTTLWILFLRGRNRNKAIWRILTKASIIRHLGRGCQYCRMIIYTTGRGTSSRKYGEMSKYCPVGWEKLALSSWI